jgi:glycine cleavage system H protein
MAVQVPDDLRYTDSHEWLRTEGEAGTVGLTAYAADQLGDVVFVELPQVGRQLKARETFGVIESVKAVSDMYAPVGGEVLAINDELAAKPELVNADPYGSGWMLKIRIAKPAEADELRDAASYRALISG